MQIEVRGDRVVIDGYVNAVGRDSRPIRCQTGDFVEQVEPGVFGKALKRAKNIKLLLNHRTDRELGSTADGNLTLTEDSIGLRAHAEIGDEEVIRKARNHQLSGWSFGMYVNESEMEQRSNAIPRRKLKDIDMFEVSIIDTTMLPCYAGTSVECRAEGEKAALLETRAYDDAVEVTEKLPENYFDEAERQLAQLRADSNWLDEEKKSQELRYNPYHDPTNGRFTTSSGAGGGYLFVGKGQKGKGTYVFDKERKNNDIEKRKSEAEAFLRQKHNNMTDANNATSAKDIEDYINYTMGQHNPLLSVNYPQSTKTYDRPAKIDFNYGDSIDVIIENKKGADEALNALKAAGYKIKKTPGEWYGSKIYNIGRKKGVRQSVWTKDIPESFDHVKKKQNSIEWNSYLNTRAINVDDAEEYLAQLRAESDWLDAEKRLGELRYNPYHDPTNGRFTTAPGAGKGQKRSIGKNYKKALTKNGSSVKLDKKGHTFMYPECDVTKEEYACFLRNVNTEYKARYVGKKMCKYYSGELDVMFYFENHGFDDYCIYRKG